MAKGLIWATAEDLVRNRGRVLSLYRQILRSINSPKLPLTFAARLAKKAEVRAIFLLASEETSLHNIEDLIDTAEYSLSLLRKGEIPKYIQWVSHVSLSLSLSLCSVVESHLTYTRYTWNKLILMNYFDVTFIYWNKNFILLFLMHECMFLVHPSRAIS